MNMRDKLLAILLIAFLLPSCTSNNDPSNDTEKVKGRVTSTLHSLNTKFQKQISGLWKLYKVEDKDGNIEVSSSNEYLNLKSDETFENDSRKGIWSLTFGDSKADLKVFLFRLYESSIYRNGELRVREINMTVENKTTFLILTDLEKNLKFYYIQQM